MRDIFSRLHNDILAIGAGLGAGAAAGGGAGADAGGGGESSLVFFEDFFLNNGNPFMVELVCPGVVLVAMVWRGGCCCGGTKRLGIFEPSVIDFFSS